MRRRRGFTILELLAVVLLISMVAAVTIPAFFQDANVTLENASILLARDLRAAQNRSAYLAEPCTFIFFRNGDGYEVRDDGGEVIVNPRIGRDFERRYSVDGVFRGVRILQVEAGPDRAITYDEHGRALEAARVTLAFGADRRVVVVAKGTGKLEIIGSSTGWRDRGH